MGFGLEGEKLKNVCFVDCGAADIALSVEQGESEEFEENEAPGGGAADRGAEEEFGFGVIAENLRKEWVLSELEIDPDRADGSGGEPFVSFLKFEVGQFFQILHRDDEVDIAGGAAVDVLEHCHGPDQEVGNLLFVQLVKELACRNSQALLVWCSVESGRLTDDRSGVGDIVKDARLGRLRLEFHDTGARQSMPKPKALALPMPWVAAS